MAKFNFGLRKNAEGGYELESLKAEHPLGSVEITTQEGKVNVEIESDNETVKSVLSFITNNIDKYLPGYGDQPPTEPPTDSAKDDDTTHDKPGV